MDGQQKSGRLRAQASMDRQIRQGDDEDQKNIDEHHVEHGDGPERGQLEYIQVLVELLRQIAFGLRLVVRPVVRRAVRVGGRRFRFERPGGDQRREGDQRECSERDSQIEMIQHRLQEDRKNERGQRAAGVAHAAGGRSAFVEVFGEDDRQETDEETDSDA